MPSNTQSGRNTKAHSASAEQSNSSATSHQAPHIRSEDVRKFVEGVKFPANKIQLVEFAKQKNAPSEIVDLLEQLPTPEFGSANSEKLTEYNSIDELLREIEKVE